ncbi:MAG TPA: OsmC family protein [Vicinamibacterales bacterium]|nr:OsmC family protein [Vicinamibacterales bacterium]
MQPFPHFYTVTSDAAPEGEVVLNSPGLPALPTATPAEFDGPGDRWSPESLLVAAVADCFLLTFRGIARASKMPWTSISCEVVGRLERIDRVTKFTDIVVRARLRVPAEASEEQAERILVRAEETCLITRSLTAVTHLETSIEVATPV